mmetsp:Transcript_7967/g.11727  ORF Transcript_7967/g.11727 Transcript_7967/m.11727 type:complete len:100 (+) Transcript_7967:145-444(+)
MFFYQFYKILRSGETAFKEVSYWRAPSPHWCVYICFFLVVYLVFFSNNMNHIQKHTTSLFFLFHIKRCYIYDNSNICCLSLTDPKKRFIFSCCLKAKQV